MHETASERAARRWRESQDGAGAPIAMSKAPGELSASRGAEAQESAGAPTAGVVLRSATDGDQAQLAAMAAQSSPAWVGALPRLNRLAVKGTSVFGIVCIETHGDDPTAPESGWLQCFCMLSGLDLPRTLCRELLRAVPVSTPVWLATSSADERICSLAAEQNYAFVGAICQHSFLRDAMRRADRTAAAAILDVHLLSHVDLDDTCVFLDQQSPPVAMIPVRDRLWRSLTRAAIADKLWRGRSYVVRKVATTDGAQKSATAHALFFAFDSDDVREQQLARHYAPFVAPALNGTEAAACLLAFATCVASMSGESGGREPGVVAGRPLECVLVSGPFHGAGDVEPRISQALAAANFTRSTEPAMRVYCLPERKSDS